MTNIQRAFCVVLSLIFLCVVAALPGDFFRHGEIYRSLPLYCFLEKKALQEENGRDLETEMLLQEKNAEHLGEEVTAENQRRQEELLMAEAEKDAAGSRDEMSGESQGGDKSAGGSEVGAKVQEEQNGQSQEEKEKTVNGSDSKVEEEQGAQSQGEKTADVNESKTDSETEEGQDGQTQGEETAGGSESKADSNAEMQQQSDQSPEPSGSEGKSQSTESQPDTDQQSDPSAEDQETVALPHPQIDLSQAKLADFDYVMNHFFILDSNTETNAGQISGTRFLEKDLSIKQDSSVPQILIYHTHSQETFSDSREGKTEDTIVGVGNYLTELLEKKYGYKVIHVTDAFDIMGGELDRSKAYDYARSSIEKVLEENPTVEVVIDLHRDGVPDDRHLVTEINGKPTAQILFYNGLSYTVNQGAVSYLPNPYIEDNLAFSFQLEYQAAQYYPQFYRGIYLAGLRYNLHLRPRAILLEAGAQTNTVEEVRNAMEPFADILNRVLKGSDKEG